MIELLEDWMKRHTGHDVYDGRSCSGALQTLARHVAPSAFDFKSVGVFRASTLRSNLATLKALFGASCRTGGAGKRLWRFSPSTDTPVEVAEPVRDESKDDDDWTPWYLEWVERTREREASPQTHRPHDESDRASGDRSSLTT